MQFSDNKSTSITKFENVPAGEDGFIMDMVLLLQNKMAKDYPQGRNET